MTKKERKKLKRVKFKRKMKNVVPKKNVDYKNIFDNNFINEGKDFLNRMFDFTKEGLALAVKKRDKEKCLLLLTALDEISNASIKVKDNVATISFPHSPDRVFALNKNSVSFQDEEYVFTDAA